jgi:hypothetical protein
MSSPRLWLLFLRARRTGPAVAWLLALAALTWWLLHATRDAGLVRFTLLVAPLGPAVVIGAVLRSPFDESERAVARPLPPLRLAQLGGLVGVAGTALALANRVVAVPDMAGLLVRNGAGYVGLACLGGVLLGAPGTWGVLLAYGALVALTGTVGQEGPPRWAWACFPAADRPATMIALALLAAELAGGAWLGSRDAPQELA